MQVGSGAGQWCMLRLEDMPSNEMCNGKPLLEFVVRGDDNSWDKPQSGDCCFICRSQAKLSCLPDP